MVLARHAAVIIIIVLVLYPFALLISLAFKDNAQFMHQRWMPTLPLYFANFIAATAAMIRYVVNSFIVTT